MRAATVMTAATAVRTGVRDGGHSLCSAASRFAVKCSCGHRCNLHSRYYSTRYTAGCTLASKTLEKMFKPVAPRHDDTMRKVTVVGAGQVGMAVVFGILTKRITNHVALVDAAPEKLKAEFLDLMHASVFLNDPVISASTEYDISAGSSICVIAVGARPKGLASRLSVLQTNADILKKVIPPLIKYSPDTILVLATNPLDVLSFAAWKISGLPVNRVIGSGCILDTARFCYFVSEKLDVSPTSIEGHIIGEHGESSVPVWSTLSVKGLRVAEVNPDIAKEKDPENWSQVGRDVVKGGPLVRNGKGYTNWAVSLCIMEICDAILKNTSKILSCSTNVKGLYGIEDEVYVSMPCAVGRNGILEIVKLRLSPSEEDKMRASALAMLKVQKSLKL